MAGKGRIGGDGKLAGIAATIVVQAIATAFFLADALADIFTSETAGVNLHQGMELLVAFSLVAGVVMGMWYMKAILADTRRYGEALAVAKGALSDLVKYRFSVWKLTAAEQEVALFALKGCDVAEIARLRHSAAGTVRAQLSHIYGKAGVTGQAMLMSLFVEELLDIAEAPPD